MNARHYDPSIGTFISADTIVPEPGLVSDYNRYGYARGNAMKYIDPSGHCIEIGQTNWNSDENIQCYQAANYIANLGGLEYIQKNFGTGYKSVEQWLKAASSIPYLDLAFLKPHADPLHQEWCRNSGLMGQAGCGGSYTENPVPESANMPVAPRALQYAVYKGDQLVNIDCSKEDCVALGLDAIAVAGNGLQLVSGACALAGGPPAAMSCYKAGDNISKRATGIGLARTGISAFNHQGSTKEDLAVSISTAVLGNLSDDPGMGARAGLVQLVYDWLRTTFGNGE